ncbi:redoxin domain-containing protein [Neolewinella persica]|uniref:redoxin domain-containing protein n=1 Tax=Neolewinella persica TaxID=70998 RepID=UPI00035ECA71|nr:redoxin domain-containing protein [Neolewinella persica]
MRLLIFLIALTSMVSCGDPAGATGTSSGSDSVTSTVTTASLEARQLESPDIRVTLTGAQQEGVLLIGQFAEQQYKAAEGVVDGNSVVFKQSEPFKPGHYYAYFTDGSAMQMLIDQDQTFSLSGNKGGALSEVKVEGSLDNQLLYETLAFEADMAEEFRVVTQGLGQLQSGSPGYVELEAERAALVEKREAFQDERFNKYPNSIFTAFKRAGRNPRLREIRLADGSLDEKAQVDGFREDFWDGVNFADIRLLNTPVIFNKLKRYITELTPQNANAIIESTDMLMEKVLPHPDYYKFIANWITLQYEPGKTTVMDGAAIHVHMIQNYFTKERAFWSDSMTVYGLQQRADQMAYSLVGQQGPDVTVPGIDGKPKRLYDLKKPYIAVFMFNPDCEHCIEETPKLVQAYEGLKNELDIYAIALDTDAAKWKSFVKQYGLDKFTNVYDPTNRSIFKTYYVDNTPELYLLGPDRKIVSKNLKVTQLAQAIELAKSKSK